MKMKTFNFLIILIILNIACNAEFETIELLYSNAYYIPIKFSPKSSVYNIRFSNSIPINLFPSINCEMCSYVMNETCTDFEFVKENISSLYYYYNFSGNEYKGKFLAENFEIEGNFIAFTNITYHKNYTGKGLFSLSYLNYNSSSTLKLFALYFTGTNGELHLGGYDKNKEKDSEIKTFNVSIDENNSTDNEFKSNWHIKFSKIYINNQLVNETNSNNLRLLKEEKNDINVSNYKLTFDIAVDGLQIPKKFFIDNLKKIFPEDGKCQINRLGYFSCNCDETYTTKFANFKFENENGEIFYINTTDYMSYTSSISGSYCSVYLMINYENDLFIAGYSVLNNYYDIFDLEKKTFTILINQNGKQSDTTLFIILFVVVFSIGIAIFFGGFYFYNKYVINDPSNNFGVQPQEEENNRQNEEGQNNIHEN